MFRLITDFDGPIADVSERYYRAYRFCLDEVRREGQPLLELSKADFWACKRAKISEIEIGFKSGLDRDRAHAYDRLRQQTTHSMPYFKYDRLIPEAIAALERCQSLGWDLTVMTMRRQRELDYAFNHFNLGRFFPDDRRYCLSNDCIKTRDIEDKPRLMAKAMEELPAAAETWMIGDTEADIAAAKAFNLPVVAVLSGIRDRDRLERYQPDAIVPNFFEAIQLVDRQAMTLAS